MTPGQPTTPMIAVRGGKFGADTEATISQILDATFGTEAGYVIARDPDKGWIAVAPHDVASVPVAKRPVEKTAEELAAEHTEHLTAKQKKAAALKDDDDLPHGTHPKSTPGWPSPGK